ncbi:hypothetical protein EV140_1693 [Microcella alkaliphila]|uniref:Uncharacterized protein n=1 Tax=Microcella alkaliphila TaxID=279828 RepID=A0A4V2FN16_9MICO|nr:hypothetical protein [Microcella alkaliphila]RZT59709.1 hypothetical protein EV140_1693 [Microcella alkaliphila]
MSFTTRPAASGGSHRRTVPSGGSVTTIASPAAMSAVLLLTTPALLWGLLLLASAALKDPGLGGLGASTLPPLGVASTVGLAGATGVALASRFAARRLARQSGRPSRRAPLTIAIALASGAALVGGGMLVASILTPAASSTPQPVTPAAELPAAPADEPSAPLFGIDHSNH